MSFSSLLDKNMNVLRLTSTSDAYGGQSVSRSTVGTALPCRINVLTFDQQAFLERQGIIATHKFFAGTEVPIVVTDELVVDSTIYPVVSVRDWDEEGHHYTILTRRLE